MLIMRIYYLITVTLCREWMVVSQIKASKIYSTSSNLQSVPLLAENGIKSIPVNLLLHLKINIVQISLLNYQNTR